MMERNFQNIYQDENKRLRELVAALGFYPDKVISEFADIDVYKSLALSALKVNRDYSGLSFSEAGVEASNRWLGSLAHSKK